MSNELIDRVILESKHAFSEMSDQSKQSLESLLSKVKKEINVVFDNRDIVAHAIEYISKKRGESNINGISSSSKDIVGFMCAEFIDRLIRL